MHQTTSHQISPHQTDSRGRQFTLRSLFELMTLCCLVAALAPSLGIGCAASLMLLSLSLHLRVGGLGVLALMAAFLLSSLPADTSSETVFSRQLAASMAAAGICGWYWVRRPGSHSPPGKHSRIRSANPWLTPGAITCRRSAA